MAFIKANEEFDEFQTVSQISPSWKHFFIGHNTLLSFHNSEKNKTTGYYLSEPVVATLKLLHRNHNSATKHIKLMFSSYE